MWRPAVAFSAGWPEEEHLVAVSASLGCGLAALL